MPETVVVRKADWIVAWDGETEGHRYLRQGDVAFRDNALVQVGGAYDGPADREIDGSGLMVMPGLVDVHSHPMTEGLNKGYAEDGGNPRLGMSGLFDWMPAFGPDLADMPTCAAVAYCELLKSGVTTLVDLSVPYDGWLDTFAASGLRGVLSPMYRSARWYTENGHEVKYRWAEDGGEASFAAALDVVDQALNHRSGRMSGQMMPAQVDTCTPEIMAKGLAAARERGITWQVHAAQSLVEFQEITRRHGMTPIRWLDSLGLLTEDSVVSHAIFHDSHSWITWGDGHRGDDLRALAANGTSVAHCPTVFVRHGMLLEDFDAYRAAGVNLGIGTDTFPHNMLEELRSVAVLSRIPSRRIGAADTAGVFEAATIGGARMLGRDDIGRLAPGAKADLVLVDCGHPSMQPLRDPLRSLIFTAAERAVRDVFVDGEQVVRDGEVTTLDYPALLQEQNAVRARAEARVPEKDYAGRSLDEVSPLSLPVG